MRRDLTDWLLNTFELGELRDLIFDWSAAKEILHKIPNNASADEFVHTLLIKLEQRNLMGVELFARIAEARPMCIAAMIPIVAKLPGLNTIPAQLEVVQRAVHRANRTGGSREIIVELSRLANNLPGLAHQIGKISKEPPRGSADAYLRDILDALADDDLRTALQLLIAYLGEHHGRGIARRQADLLLSSNNNQLRDNILEQVSRHHERDTGAGPPLSEVHITQLHKLRGGPTTTNTVFASIGFNKTYRLNNRVTYKLECSGLNLALGELVGVVGPNGSGKSTLLEILAGRLAPDHGGRIAYPRLDPSEPARGQLDWNKIHPQIYFVPQRLEPWRETVAHELSIHAVQCGVRGQANEDEVRYVCLRLGLTAFLQHKWWQVSGGYRLKLELAKALLTPAELLIFDEPLAMLDGNAEFNFLESIKSIACEEHRRRAVVISTHHIWNVEKSANRILYINRGQVTEGSQDVGVCLEITGQFTDEFIVLIKAFGQISTPHYKRPILLLESNALSFQQLCQMIFTAAQSRGVKLDSIRDITDSYLRVLYKKVGQ